MPPTHSRDPEPVAKMTLCRYKKYPEWKALIDLSRDYLLGHILLEHSFPSTTDLKAFSIECICEAQSMLPRLHLDLYLDTYSGN